MLRILSALFFVMSAASAHASEDPLSVLSAYAGTWSTAVNRYDTEFSKAGVEHSSLRNDCWRSGNFYTCRQIVDGDEKALLVFIYDAERDLYRSFPIQTNSNKVFAGTLSIKGAVWTFPWEMEDKGQQVHFRVTNTFRDPTHIDYVEEYSFDSEHWITTARGHEFKAD